MRELSARWVACTAASGRCGRLRAVVGSRDRGEKPRCLVAVENFGDLPQPPDHVQIPYQGSGVMHLGSADLQATGVLVAVRRYEWLQGTSRLEATVLLAADVLLLQSRRCLNQITYPREEECIACFPLWLTSIYIDNDDNREETRMRSALS